MDYSEIISRYCIPFQNKGEPYSENIYVSGLPWYWFLYTGVYKLKKTRSGNVYELPPRALVNIHSIVVKHNGEKWVLMEDASYVEKTMAESDNLFGKWNSCLITHETWWTSAKIYILMLLLLLALLFPHTNDIYNSITLAKTLVIALFVGIVSSIVGFF